ncbi:MAG: TonB-dependent receptor [Bacteroidota bacterium]|nr:TonB-dependent receptor [Bacteroidota bacterium]
MKFYTYLLLLFLPLAAFTQVRHTVSGTIRDKNSGEVLIGANVTLLTQSRIGVVSNAYGFYSLSAPAGTYDMVVSFAGYQPDTIKLDLQKNLLLPVELGFSSAQLQAVVVSTRRKNENVTQPIMGVQKLTMSEVKNVPVLFGEKDILKTIQLLPGIKSAGEGSSGFYVRGGASDQNLILLDEATVYNASHLLGFFSTFNSDAIKDVTVYKGGMPAEYGGRLSSVVDIKMNDGNDKKFVTTGGIGLISSRLNVEGPIVKDKGSFSISGRRTYADLFLKISHDTAINNNSLYFYDLNLKANYKINQKNTIYLSGYFGKDNLGLGKTFGLSWGNSTGTFRWNHLFNSRLFSNTSLIYSNYNYVVKLNSADNDINVNSQIQDVNLKEDLQYYVNANNKINFGFNVIHHTILPGSITASSSSSFNSLYLQKKYSVESAAYISNTISPVEKLQLNYGLRLTNYTIFGPGDFYTYNKAGEVTNTVNYAAGKVVRNYFNPEPRFSTSYQVSNTSSVKASYTRNIQNLHLLSNSTSSNPTDLWLSSSNNIKPEIADQVALGYYRNFKDNGFEFSSEIYYKTLQNQIDYKNGAQLRANENVESQLLLGKGRAYGLELFLKKRYGKLTGWISYTLSRTERKFDEINHGSYYPATQDRTHDFSIVGIYQASSKWTLSSTWVYYTGNAITWPSGKYNVNGQVVFYYTERNGYRMPSYHRLDLSATLQGKKKPKFAGSWTFSVYNAYGRENPYTISFRQSKTDPQKTEAVQLSLFRLIPSVTYNFKF